jgi:D-glycerate 3-kinase
MCKPTFDAVQRGLVAESDVMRIVENVSDRFSDAVKRLNLDINATSQLENIYIPLATILHRKASLHSGPLLVGISGAQGSGKSTLNELLSIVLQDGFDLKVTGFSIDDIYTTRDERIKMSEKIHPLLMTRGVPGTHDLKLGEELLNALNCQDRGKKVIIPVFDKATDDRRPPKQWRIEHTPFDIVLFEGWCIGACPQDVGALAEPINDLEAKEDKDRRWRKYVNLRLATDYAKLFGRIDLLIWLEIPDFDFVRKWRSLQESKLASGSKAENAFIMDESALQRFIMHYERLTRHMLTEMPDRADIILQINEDHRICEIQYKLLAGLTP